MHRARDRLSPPLTVAFTALLQVFYCRGRQEKDSLLPGDSTEGGLPGRRAPLERVYFGPSLQGSAYVGTYQGGMRPQEERL